MPCLQVAMQQWLDRNFRSVTAMYEDRHELWGFDHRGRLFRRMLPARRAQVAVCFSLISI